MHMSFRVSGVLFGLVLWVASCGGGDGGSLTSDCAKLCATTNALKSAMDNPATCQSQCEALPGQVPKCKDQFEAVIKCSAAQPQSNFECKDGEAELKDGACDAEGQAAALCFLGGS